VKESLRKKLTQSDDSFESALKALSSHDSAFFDSLDAESDRGVALCARAFFENLMGGFLSAYFVDHPASSELLQSNTGLRSFASRLNCCRALRIVDNDQYKQLKIVSKVGNEFAHDLMANFDSPRIKEIAKILHTSVFEREPASDDRAPEKGRDAFTVSCLVLALDLQWRSIDIMNYTKRSPDVIPFKILLEAKKEERKARKKTSAKPIGPP
jgi:hypothetical protein